MCYKIDSEYLVANYFIHNMDKAECSFRELNKLKTELESKIPGIYIDLSRNSISWMLDAYPSLFSLSDRGIKMIDTTSKDPVIDFNEQINLWLDNSVKKQLDHYFESY